MDALYVLAVVSGLALLAGDLIDLVRALVVPRPHTAGPISATMEWYRAAAHHLAAHMRRFEARDRFLAAVEAFGILVRLSIWLDLGLVGFALVSWGVGNVAFGQSFIESGSAIFTLGFATEPHVLPEVVSFLAAAFGLVVIALQIAYLPALYDAFNRRETLVTMLESRAGTPPWGPELLARHFLVGIETNLADFYSQWERWAADVGESHTTYPLLLNLRSPHETNNWLLALLAVCDSAALFLALSPEVAPTEARLCVRMGFSALRDIARALRIPFDPDPLPDCAIELTFSEFQGAVEHMRASAVRMERTAEQAWPHFHGWRVNYEAVAYSLADRIFAPAAPWSGTRTHDRGPVQVPKRPLDRKPDNPEGVPQLTASVDPESPAS